MAKAHKDSKKYRSKNKISKSTSKSSHASTKAGLTSNSKDFKFYFKKLKDFWDYVWNGDDFLSLVLSIFFAFIIIKFLFYPGLSLILGTTHPVVAIVSGSMEHKISDSGSLLPMVCGNIFDKNKNLNLDEYWNYCGSWYEGEKISISKYEFSEFRYKNGLNIGDVMVLVKAKPDKLKVGDVIVFIQKENPRLEPIIHRIVKISNSSEGILIQTKGDHNKDSIDVETYSNYINEYDIREEDLVGKAIIRIPWIGYVKIWAYEAYLWVTGLF